MKLQDAFIAESGNQMGTFTDISYEIGNASNETTDFRYSTAIDAKGNIAQTADAWKAVAKSGLNNCESGGAWSLQLAPSSTGNGAAWTASVSSNDCKSLTPRFEELSRGTAATGDNGGQQGGQQAGGNG